MLQLWRRIWARRCSFGVQVGFLNHLLKSSGTLLNWNIDINHGINYCTKFERTSCKASFCKYQSQATYLTHCEILFNMVPIGVIFYLSSSIGTSLIAQYVIYLTCYAVPILVQNKLPWSHWWTRGNIQTGMGWPRFWSSFSNTSFSQLASTGDVGSDVDHLDASSHPIASIFL